MHNDSDKPDDSQDGRRDPGSNSDGTKAGFLMIRVKRGDEIQVGDATVCFNEIAMGYAKVGIKAPRSVKVQRKPR